jgi:hypothetical protein
MHVLRSAGAARQLAPALHLVPRACRRAVLPGRKSCCGVSSTDARHGLFGAGQLSSDSGVAVSRRTLVARAGTPWEGTPVAADVEAELQQLQSFIGVSFRDAAFKERLQNATALRQALGGGETAAEAELLHICAVAFYKLRDADEMVSLFSRLYPEEAHHMRSALVLSMQEACAQAEASLPPTFKQDGGALGVLRKIASRSQPATDDEWRQMYPSIAGLPPNAEVDAHHEHSRMLQARMTTINVTNAHAVQSPFGPVMSSGSLDELSPVSLRQLLMSKTPMPGLCLQFTVVAPAFVASCVTAVVADESGQHIRLSVYNTPAKDDAGAQAFLPLGARFALKNPFLKRCNDQWLGVRVDQPAALVRLDLLPLQAGSRLLVLGDGDFPSQLRLPGMTASELLARALT